MYTLPLYSLWSYKLQTFEILICFITDYFHPWLFFFLLWSMVWLVSYDTHKYINNIYQYTRSSNIVNRYMTSNYTYIVLDYNCFIILFQVEDVTCQSVGLILFQLKNVLGDTFLTHHTKLNI